MRLPDSEYEDNQDNHQQGVNDGRLNKHQAQHQGGAHLALRLGLPGDALGGLGGGQAHGDSAGGSGDAHGDAGSNGFQAGGIVRLGLGLGGGLIGGGGIGGESGGGQGQSEQQGPCKHKGVFPEFFHSRHIKEQNPTAGELRTWYERSGLPLKKFFNTSGLLYKELGLKDKLPNMSEEEQIALLASDGMLVKRPILVGDGFVLTGFRETEWSAALGIQTDD